MEKPNQIAIIVPQKKT